MARPRNKKNQNLPDFLYFEAGKGYRFTLINGMRKTLGFDRNKAVAIANAYNIKMRQGDALLSLINITAPSQADESLSNYIDALHKTILSEENPSPKVAASLANDIERAKDFFTMHPHDIDISLVTKYLETYHKNCSNEVYNKKVGFLKKLFGWAMDEGIMLSNPAADKKRRKTERKQRKRLTVEMYQAIYAHADVWLKTAMDLSLQTTQARLEVSRIRYRLKKPSATANGCVWFKEPKQVNGFTIYGEMYINRQKTIEKEESHVCIPIGEALKQIIDKSREDKIISPYIVHRLPIKISNKLSKECDHITQITPKYISTGFSKARDKSGVCDHLPVNQRPTFHEVRALAARLFKDQGYDPQSRMAHSDAKSTKVYTRDHVRWVEVPHAEIAI